jgi:hypothetical protein
MNGKSWSFLASAMVLAAWAGSPGSATAAVTELYASPSGSGALCTLAAPCSLTGARALARTLIPTMTDDIRINLRGGTYALSAPFELTGSADSGVGSAFVRYEAYAGEVPVLSGGTTITGWTQVATARWRAPVPPTFLTRQLYVDGVRGQRPRSDLGAPGFNFTETADGYQVTATGIATWRNVSDIEIVDLVKWKQFRCGVDSIAVSGSLAEIKMDTPCWNLAQWHQGTFGGGSFDLSMGAIDDEEPNGLGWIENAYELLLRPGDWYHDRTENFVYYVPRAGQDMATAVVVAPVLETLFRAQGTPAVPIRNVKVVGLTFADAGWVRPSTPAGYPVLVLGQMTTTTTPPPPLVGPLEAMPGNVAVRAARDVTFERNTFTRLGATALAVEMGCQGVTVAGNLFHDVSGGGIVIGDLNFPNPPEAEITRDILVHDNVITDIGVEYWDTAAIFASFTDSASLVHNEIYNVPYTGIALGWFTATGAPQSFARDNLVASNLIHHVMQKVFDGGLIYAEGSQPGSVLSDNYLHNQADEFGALYLDFAASGFDVTRNVVASAPYWWLLTGGPALIRSVDNAIHHNFTETPAYQCGESEEPPAGDCFVVNKVSDNTEVPPQTFHPSALPIMQAAGLTSAYLSIKPATVRVEAEDYDAGMAYDTTPGNQGGSKYRPPDSVDLFWDLQRSNQVVVGNTASGEWLPYHVDAPMTGTYTFGFSVSTLSSGNTIGLIADSVLLGSVTLPNTLGAYQTVELPAVSLAQGPHIAGLALTGDFKLDYFYYRR